MLKTIGVRTSRHTQMIDITDDVERIVRESGVREGTCLIFVLHTTAAVTINENADPDGGWIQAHGGELCGASQSVDDGIFGDGHRA